MEGNIGTSKRHIMVTEPAILEPNVKQKVQEGDGSTSKQHITQSTTLKPDAKQMVPGRIYKARICMEPHLGVSKENLSHDSKKNIESGGKKGPARPCLLMRVLGSNCHICPLTSFNGKPIDKVDTKMERLEFYKTFIPVAPHLSVIPDNKLYDPVNIHHQLKENSYVHLHELSYDAQFVLEVNIVHEVEQVDFQRVQELVESFRKEADKNHSLRGRDDNSGRGYDNSGGGSQGSGDGSQRMDGGSQGGGSGGQRVDGGSQGGGSGGQRVDGGNPERSNGCQIKGRSQGRDEGYRGSDRSRRMGGGSQGGGCKSQGGRGGGHGGGGGGHGGGGGGYRGGGGGHGGGGGGYRGGGGGHAGDGGGHGGGSCRGGGRSHGGGSGSQKKHGESQRSSDGRNRRKHGRGQGSGDGSQKKWRWMLKMLSLRPIRIQKMNAKEVVVEAKKDRGQGRGGGSQEGGGRCQNMSGGGKERDGYSFQEEEKFYVATDETQHENGSISGQSYVHEAKNDDDDEDIDWNWEPSVESPFLGYCIELTQGNLEDVDWSWDGQGPWLPIEGEFVDTKELKIEEDIGGHTMIDEPTSIIVSAMESFENNTDNTARGSKLKQVNAKAVNDLVRCIDWFQVQCLNENAPDCTFQNALYEEHWEDDSYLESDADAELLLTIPFGDEMVNLHSLIIKGPQEEGPKTVKLYVNKPNMDFSDVSDPATETVIVTLENLETEKPIELKRTEFKNVRCLTLFIEDNQGGGSTTRIQKFAMFGSRIDTTNMDLFEFAKGCGKETQAQMDANDELEEKRRHLEKKRI